MCGDKSPSLVWKKEKKERKKEKKKKKKKKKFFEVRRLAFDICLVTNSYL